MTDDGNMRATLFMVTVSCLILALGCVALTKRVERLEAQVRALSVHP